jgi:Family of unknown function (DUF6152)
MDSRRAGLYILAVGLTSMILATRPAVAHHSFAMFDDKLQVTMDATVKEFQWTNPHMWLQVLVIEGGQPVEYSIEGGPPLVMGRKGWNRLSFKAGDQVKLTINPTKDAAVKGGSFVKAEFADGHTLTGRF